MKTIFNTYIQVTSKKQADRLKGICIENKINSKYKDAFDFEKRKEGMYFRSSKSTNLFFISFNNMFNDKKVTESEWLELLKEYKK